MEIESDYGFPLCFTKISKWTNGIFIDTANWRLIDCKYKIQEKTASCVLPHLKFVERSQQDILTIQIKNWCVLTTYSEKYGTKQNTFSNFI